MPFQHAITRKPGNNFADGITTADFGRPDFPKALEQHRQYGETLRKCGLELTVLEADDQYPDGCFVEDTAVVTEAMAIITQPGDPTRLGEQGTIAEVLATSKKLEFVESPGTLEGGDIMRVEDHFYIGLSNRTNQAGARQLAEILARYGYSSSTIPVETVLHLKTGITYLGNDLFIAMDEFASVFKASQVISLDADENYAANCLLVNDHILIPKGFPKAKQHLLALGYDLIEVDMSEFRKMDGGLTCLSLLF